MDFSKSIEKFGNATVKQIDSEVRKVAFNLYSDIVKSSPVKTGRFRGANMISIDTPTNTAPIEVRKNPIGEETSKLKVPIEGRDIYIQNNIAYATELEFGKSKQAPQGIYRINLLRYKQGLNL